ncbi:hypothetical protein AgCh_001693 [Apium graveolens]
MRSSVNNAQKPTDGEKSPPMSLEPVGLHPSPRLPPPPPLPVDLTKIERVPNNQGIGTMDAYLETQKQKREMQNTNGKQATKYIIPEERKYWVLKTLDDNWRMNPDMNVNIDELCVESSVEVNGLDDDEENRDDDDGDVDGGDESDEDGDEVDSDDGDESS